MPKISVIMTNYNGAKYIEESILSIINQSYNDWELIIVDDESTDESRKIVKKFNDERIFLLRSGINSGPAVCRNIALNFSKGEYIAILDSDDISMKFRLEIQLKYMEKNRNVDILGCSAEYFENKKKHIVKPLINNSDIKAKILFDSPFTHSTIMMRKASIIANNLRYNEDFPKAQDYELWAQCRIKNLTFSGIEDVLVKYRLHKKQITRSSKNEQLTYANKVRQMQFVTLLGKNYNEDIIIFIDNLVSANNLDIDQLKEFEKLLKLLSYNAVEKGNFEEKPLNECCALIFRLKCIHNLLKCNKAGAYYWKSYFRKYDKISLFTLFKMIILQRMYFIRGIIVRQKSVIK